MDTGKKILHRRAELGIKTNVELAEKMGGKVRPQTIGKWIAGKTTPRGTSLKALAKALKISADFILFDEGENPEQTKSLERMVTTIVKSELHRTSILPMNEIEEVMGSEEIPQEEKESLLRQARNLLKLYRKEKKPDKPA